MFSSFAPLSALLATFTKSPRPETPLTLSPLAAQQRSLELVVSMQSILTSVTLFEPTKPINAKFQQEIEALSGFAELLGRSASLVEGSGEMMAALGDTAALFKEVNIFSSHRMIDEDVQRRAEWRYDAIQYRCENYIANFLKISAKALEEQLDSDLAFPSQIQEIVDYNLNRIWEAVLVIVEDNQRHQLQLSIFKEVLLTLERLLVKVDVLQYRTDLAIEVRLDYLSLANKLKEAIALVHDWSALIGCYRKHVGPSYFSFTRNGHETMEIEEALRLDQSLTEVLSELLVAMESRMTLRASHSLEHSALRCLQIVSLWSRFRRAHLTTQTGWEIVPRVSHVRQLAQEAGLEAVVVLLQSAEAIGTLLPVCQRMVREVESITIPFLEDAFKITQTAEALGSPDAPMALLHALESIVSNMNDKEEDFPIKIWLVSKQLESDVTTKPIPLEAEARSAQRLEIVLENMSGLAKALTSGSQGHHASETIDARSMELQAYAAFFIDLGYQNKNALKLDMLELCKNISSRIMQIPIDRKTESRAKVKAVVERATKFQSHHLIPLFASKLDEVLDSAEALLAGHSAGTPETIAERLSAFDQSGLTLQKINLKVQPYVSFISFDTHQSLYTQKIDRFLVLVGNLERAVLSWESKRIGLQRAIRAERTSKEQPHLYSLETKWLADAKPPISRIQLNYLLQIHKFDSTTAPVDAFRKPQAQKQQQQYVGLCGTQARQSIMDQLPKPTMPSSRRPVPETGDPSDESYWTESQIDDLISLGLSDDDDHEWRFGSDDDDDDQAAPY